MQTPAEDTISDFKADIPISEADPTSAFSRPHAYIEMAEGRLARWRFGRGPDVVFIHGWPLHAATFRRVVPKLAERFTLHLFDLPGAGHSIDWTGHIDLVSHAKTIRRAIDELGLGRYALVSHDSGGAVARLVAADDARVAGLILSGTEIPGHRPPLVREYSAAAKIPGTGTLIRAAMRRRAIRRSSIGFGGCFSDPSFVDGDFGNLFVRPLLESKRTYEMQMRLVRDLDFAVIDGLTAVHARIRAPVLCIWGSDDPFFPVAKARRMLEQFGGSAEFVEIAGAKLYVHEDHPQLFAEHALTFLSRCNA
jgi:pimeloyl-ACP methyl ester carboxylesterase